MSIEELKQKAAAKAVERVESGMRLGLGSGSTTSYAVHLIGQMWQRGELTDIVGVPTSSRTEKIAHQYNLPLGTLGEYGKLDLAIDGADEVDPQFNLIKGLGGALLREKMVELCAVYFIVIVDETKPVSKLGTKDPVPVEVTQFGWQHQANWLTAEVGCTPVLRERDGQIFVTDNGNYILDCRFENGINDPAALNAQLHGRTGVVEHGMFLGMADEVIVAGSNGIRVMTDGGVI